MIQGDTLEVVRTVLTHLWEAENVTSPLCPHLLFPYIFIFHSFH